MISRRTLLTTGAVAAVGSAGIAAANAPSAHTLTAVDVHPSDYPTVEAVRWIGDELARETEGRINFRLYPSGQLGNETDTVNLARFGVLDIARVYLGAVNNMFPATQPLALPYTFQDEAHMRRVVDGDIGREILATFERRGLIGLAFYDSGMRSMYNARQTVLDAGVQANRADKEAFRRAVEPMRRRYLENDAIVRVVQRIEAQA